MISLTNRLLLYLVIWATTISAFTFTNSFNGWVGNATYTITWSSSTFDPSYYNLVLARPHNVSNAGVEVNATWPIDWSMRVATQIPSFGDQLFTFTLPVDCQPGYYYWNIPVSTTFFIANSPSVAPSSTQSAVTISSFVPVTATQSVVGTSDGQLVTFKPSDVFSSVVVYTTIVVTAEGGRGMPRGKIHMIIGVSLAALFLITMPIVVWLVLRYRRGPIEPYNSPSSSDKRIPGSDAEGHPSSSALDLLALDTTGGDPFASDSAVSAQSTRQMWNIVDGEKRQINLPRYPPGPAPSASSRDPFADPLVPSRQQSFPRIAIPHNSNEPNNSTSSSSTPIDVPLPHGDTATSHTVPGVMRVRNGTSVETQRSTTQLGEKASRPTRPSSTHEAQPLSPEEASARIFIPGRAVDMGPLGRSRFGDVDENGLLPPDYSQAVQPIKPPQAGLGGH